MIARLGLTSREIKKAVLVAFRSKEILVSFKMVLKYRDRQGNIVARGHSKPQSKGSKGNSSIPYGLIHGVSLTVSQQGHRSIVFLYEHNARQDENAVRCW